MRLLKCHIDGFGKLQNLDLDFERGLNIFLQNNGWGKSTLAAFLRVMLYGFEGEGKRNDLENERKKYLPWAGRQYGGNLSFEVGNKSYVVYRTFGNKAKDDSFRLIDLSTNLESEDYSTELGQELFQIDQASFKRTSFMEQQDLVTGGTDSISAKLSNLCEDTDDLNNYEKVCDFLTKGLNNMSPTRATGSISGLNSEIGALKVELREKEQLEKAIDELTTRINDKHASGNAFSTEVKSLKELELQLIKQESRKAVLQKKEDLLREKERREEHFKQLRSTVPGQLPAEEDIEEAKKQLRHLNNMELQLAEKKVTEEEAKRVQELDMIFANGIPEDEELLNAEKMLTDLTLTGQKLDILEADLRLEQEKYTKELHAMGARLKRIHFRRVYGALIFLIYALAEGLLFLNRGHIATNLFPYLTIGGLVAGILCLTVFFAVIEISYKRASKMPSSEYRDRKEAEVLDAKGRMESRKKELSAFLTKYNAFSDTKGYAQVLNGLEHDKMEYVRLSDKVTYAEKSGILAEKQETEGKIKGFLEATGLFLTGDYGNDLQNLTVCRREIQNAEAEAKAADERLREFEKENAGYEDYQTTTTNSEYTLPELREKIEHIEVNIAENDRFIKLEEKRRDDMLEDLEELNSKSELLAEKQEQLETLKHKYKNYENTLKYLRQAHEELNSSLLAPLSGSFRQHLNEMGYGLSGQDTDKVFVDSHAEVTIEEAGDRHELKFFSAGTRDLISVAMRIALLDNMYGNEKPFVILDDPFVNLDEGKMTIAKDFLQKISEGYQVLYFTCRDRFV